MKRSILTSTAGLIFQSMCVVGLGLLFAIGCTSHAQDKPDPLPSWNDAPAKRAIVAFVKDVTSEGGSGFVSVASRIAVFDNDGTLWAEQPVYFQFLFAVDRAKALAPQHPEWKNNEPFASLLNGDMKTVLASGEHGMLNMVAATHSGMTTEEFKKLVKDWLTTAKHPKNGRPYTQMAYQPMIELLAYLRANGFKTFIVSGGGVEFIRAFAEQTYGIPPEQVMGSTGQLKFDLRDGKPALIKSTGVDFVNDGEGKPISIQRFIGRRPIAAFGNSDGDLQMLQWTAAGPGPSFCLYVHHDDSDREWAYDRQSSVGRLDKGLHEASVRHWTVASMKTDWNRIFVFENDQEQRLERSTK